MAKIPKEILEKKVPTMAQKLSMSRSPVNPTPIIGKTLISGNRVQYSDGTYETFSTREAAYQTFKRERKNNGETY
jgi:hypothetical protein